MSFFKINSLMHHLSWIKKTLLYTVINILQENEKENEKT